MAGKRRTLYLNNDDEWNQFKALAKPSPSAVISDFVRSYIGTDKAAPQPKKPKRNIDLQVIKELCNSHAWFQVLWNYQPERWWFHLDLDPAGWVEHVEAVYGCCDLVLEAVSAIDYLSAKGLVRTNIISFFEANWLQRSFTHQGHLENTATDRTYSQPTQSGTFDKPSEADICCWKRTLESIRKALRNDSDFNTYLANTQLIGLRRNIAYVRVPNAYRAQWIETHVKGAMRRGLEQSFGRKIKTEFIFDEGTVTLSRVDFAQLSNRGT